MDNVQRKRPKWVWVFFIFYLFSAVYTLLSFYLINSGVVTVEGTAKTHLASLTAAHYAIGILIGSANLLGAFSLFFLRKIAYPLLLFSLVANVLLRAWIAWLLLSRNMLWAFVSEGGIGVLIGLGLQATVCLYAKKLTKLGVLR